MTDYFPLECADSLLAIGVLVKQRRLQHKQRQKDLAHSLSMSERTVRKIEAGDASVELRSFMLVLWHLGLIDEVFHDFRQRNATLEPPASQRVRLPRLKGDF